MSSYQREENNDTGSARQQLNLCCFPLAAIEEFPGLAETFIENVEKIVEAVTSPKNRTV